MGQADGLGVSWREEKALEIIWPECLYPVWYRAELLGRQLLRLAHPLNRDESYRPFFIVGGARSGTTLLRRILQASPELHIPPEVWGLRKAIGLFRCNRNLDWWFLVHNVLALFEFQKNFHVFNVSLRPLVQKLLKTPKESRSLAFLLNAFYRYHGEQTGSTFERWGDKSPINVYSLDRIRAVFPDATFIYVIRDGVDVVYSCMKANPEDYDIRTAALQWRMGLRKFRSFTSSHRRACFEVRYEKLVMEPYGQVKNLSTFLGIEYHPNMVESLEHVDSMGDVLYHSHLKNAAKPVTVASIGKGRRALSHQQRSRLQRLIGRELATLGYEGAV